MTVNAIVRFSYVAAEIATKRANGARNDSNAREKSARTASRFSSQNTVFSSLLLVPSNSTALIEFFSGVKPWFRDIEYIRIHIYMLCKCKYIVTVLIIFIFVCTIQYIYIFLLLFYYINILFRKKFS